MVSCDLNGFWISIARNGLKNEVLDLLSIVQHFLTYFSLFIHGGISACSSMFELMLTPYV